MHNRELKCPLGRHFVQEVEETDRIGAAGDSHADALAGGEHAVAGNGGAQAVEHGTIVSPGRKSEYRRLSPFPGRRVPETDTGGGALLCFERGRLAAGLRE